MGTSEKNSKPVFGVEVWVGLAVLLAAVMWAYWPTVTTMAGKWENDPQYSHGWLVPLFAIALLWLRWDKLEPENLKTSWWGVGLLVLGAAMRLGAGWINFDWFDGMSIIPTLAGLCMLFGGVAAMKWAWPAFAFLVFMVPLPFQVERMMMGPLRNLGTVTSSYVMQTLGLPAIAEGNIIHLGEHTIGVAEACSGLRMLVIFFALSAAVALIIDRNIWVRLLILASAIPIALISNIARITITGMAYQLASPELAESLFHDWAGWLMMPFGLLMLWGELWLLSHLFIEDSDDDYDSLAMGFSKTATAANSNNGGTESDAKGSGKIHLPLP